MCHKYNKRNELLQHFIVLCLYYNFQPEKEYKLQCSMLANILCVLWLFQKIIIPQRTFKKDIFYKIIQLFSFILKILIKEISNWLWSYVLQLQSERCWRTKNGSIVIWLKSPKSKRLQIFYPSDLCYQGNTLHIHLFIRILYRLNCLTIETVFLILFLQGCTLTLLNILYYRLESVIPYLRDEHS